MVSPDHTADFVIKTAEPETADIRVHATFPFTLRSCVVAPFHLTLAPRRQAEFDMHELA